MKSTKRKLKFLRSNVKSFKRLKNVWRKPKGMHNKLRHQFKGYGNVVSTGYCSDKSTRGKHTSGKEFMLLENNKQVELVTEKHIVILGSNIGQKKKVGIIKKLREKNIEIHNIKNVDEFLKNIETNMQQRKDKKKKVEKKDVNVEKKEEKKELTEEEKKKKSKEEKDKVLTQRKI